MGVLFVFLASLLWALDTLIRYPLIFGGLSATKIVFFEHVLLVVCFLPVFFSNKFSFNRLSKKDIFYFSIIGGLGSALATLAFTKAFGILNPSLVIILQKFQPLVAISMAYVILKEPIKKEFLIWALLCLAGGILISYKDLSAGLKIILSGSLPFTQKAFMGYFLTFVAVFGWGASTVFGKKLILKGHSEAQLMAGRFLFGLIFLIPAILNQENPLITEIKTWGQIFIMVIVSGILAMTLYYQGLKRISARLTALAEMFFPFCAIAVNWIFLEAKLAPIQLLGGALLLVGSTVFQLKRY